MDSIIDREPRDYRDYLRRAFLARRAERPGFSLRAFARELGLSPSHLCEILKGGQNLSAARARAIAPRLGLSPDGADGRRFAALVDVAGSQSAVVRRAAERALSEAGAGGEWAGGYETLVLAYDRQRQREAFQRLSELCAAFNAEFAGDGEGEAVRLSLRLVPAGR